MSNIVWHGLTDPGKVRENNEDAWVVDPSISAAIVADGMGGASCGEVGSAITVESITAYLRRPLEELDDEQLVREAIRNANRNVLEAARQRTECEGMGSTVVLALWRPPRVIMANVGDSRAYLWRRGEFRQLSYDQNLGNEMRMSTAFSEEQIRQMPHQHVLTMAVGAFEDVLIRMHTEVMEDGDLVLLCSDGLHGYVPDAAIAGVLAQAAGLREKVESLVEAANRAGGLDNITVVILQYQDGAE